MKEKKVATFAKYMICPDTLNGDMFKESLSKQGVSDFIAYPYRIKSDHYLGSSSSNAEDLLQEVVEAVVRCSSDKSPLLLLSDGKDSMCLALAYAELGKSIDTLTLLRREDEELKEYIVSVCKQLGHRAHFVNVDEILNNFSKDFFLDACKVMENPVLDQGFLFFLFGIRAFFEKSGFDPTQTQIVDGLGNDETFGYIPSKSQYRSFKLSKLGLWKLASQISASLKWYARSPSESHGDLSALACFFPIGKAYDLNDYFSKVPKGHMPIEVVDFRAFSRGAFHDHQCMMGKTITTAKILGSEIVFPWIDDKLAHYVFNLPLDKKFDFSSLKNKVLLRNLLSKKIDWSQQKRGVDLYFDLDEKKFISEVLSLLVSENAIMNISKNRVVPVYVKKRAFLELLNFYGYCLSNGMNEYEIIELLEG